jgi:hypothetical protein
MDYPNLTCSRCARVYNIGVDSIVVAPEVAFTTLTPITIGRVPSIPDLVSVVRPENVAGAMERMKPHWKVIEANLLRGQRREWKCHTCSTVNTYTG